MPPSQTLIHLVLALAKTADLDLLEDTKLLSSVQKQAAAAVLTDMLRGYDYLASQQFEAMSANKSAAVVDAMRRRLSAPEKRSEKLTELYDAVRELMNSNRIFDFLPKSSEATVTSLRNALSALDDQCTRHDLSRGRIRSQAVEREEAHLMLKYNFSLSNSASPTPKALNRKSLDLIYPYVVPKTWVEYAGADALLTWEFSDDVRMVLVVDGKGNVRNLRPQDLEDLGETPESAFDIATRNLARSFEQQEFQLGSVTLLDGVQIGCARGNWMAPAGGLMLGALYDAMTQQFGTEEFAAVAVNQQCLFAFPTDERTLASDSLRAAIDDEFGGSVKPISRSWLKLDGSWPSAHPLNGAFEAKSLATETLLEERLKDLAGSIATAASNAPDEYPEWSAWTYETHMTDLRELWAEIQPQLTRDTEKAHWTAVKLGEMFSAFEKGDKASGRKAAWALYNSDVKKLR
jgi:hypothetical protein